MVKSLFLKLGGGHKGGDYILNFLGISKYHILNLKKKKVLVEIVSKQNHETHGKIIKWWQFGASPWLHVQIVFDVRV